MSTTPFADAALRVVPVDDGAARLGLEHQERLTKPRGSLGALEEIGVQLCAIAADCPPPVPEPVRVAVFAADHGVVAEGVTPWPQEVTAQMVANFCNGGGAINVLARHGDMDVVVVDVGVAADIPVESPALLRRAVRRGTRNLAQGPALTADEVDAALDVGAEVATAALADGFRMLVTGDMGIGNTTASAAVIAALTSRPAAEVTGRGTGIDDAMLSRKTAVVAEAVDRLTSRQPHHVLEQVGGLEIAALTGFMTAGAAGRVPVVIDGVISAAAALCASALVPQVAGYLISGHRSTEPGASAVLSFLGLDPVIDLSMRLGEGSGAALAVPVVQAAAKILREMATFDSAGVTDKDG